MCHDVTSKRLMKARTLRVLADAGGEELGTKMVNTTYIRLQQPVNRHLLMVAADVCNLILTTMSNS